MRLLETETAEFQDQEMLEQFPNREEVENANRKQLVRWHTLLREPQTLTERSLLERVIERINETAPEGIPHQECKPVQGTSEEAN
jgi:hypothetical protein